MYQLQCYVTRCSLFISQAPPAPAGVPGTYCCNLLCIPGFRCSRSKMGDMIKGGDVRVNWRPASKASQEVKAGDVVSVAGKGRLEIRAVDVTKKQKYAVAMVRFV